jgi:hypothetical protein
VGDLVTINAVMVGIFVFTVGCLVAGMFFAGIDATPPDKVGITVTIIAKFVGVGLILSAIPMFLSSPYMLAKIAGTELVDVRMSPGVALWFGTLLAYFGILWLWLSETLSKGGDLKPIGIMLLFSSLILFAYAVMSPKFADMLGMKLFGTGYLGQMFGDVFILTILAGIACLLAFIGIRFRPALVKYAGYMFVIVGLWGVYMSVRYVYELAAASIVGI